MQTALRMTTTVHADGKVEFIVPQAAQEETLEIIVLFPEHRLAAARPKRSVMDILNEVRLGYHAHRRRHGNAKGLGGCDGDDGEQWAVNSEKLKVKS